MPNRLLHWGTALMVLAAFAVALIMTDVEARDFLLRFWLYQAHKTIGLLVLLACLARLGLRLLGRGPGPVKGLPTSKRRLAGLGHAALYGLLLAMPVLGLLVADTAPQKVPTLFLGLWRLPVLIGPDAALFEGLSTLHMVLAWTLVVLALGHGAMAIHHHRRGLDVLRRML
uniref:cytochrome b n=1 Tax=Zavarzinia marina TaxID=2911065 RepID=UPI0038B4FD9A